MLGGLGASGHSDDPDDPQQRHHEEPEDLPLTTLKQSGINFTNIFLLNLKLS